MTTPANPAPPPPATEIVYPRRISWVEITFIVVVAVFAIMLLARCWNQLTAPAAAAPQDLPAHLLLLLTLLFCFSRAFIWVGTPLDDARLGSIAQLQWCPTPANVKRTLDTWTSQLLRRNLGHPAFDRPLVPDPDEEDGPDDAGRMRRAHTRMQDAVDEAEWRDMLGFIPLYTAMFITACWIVQSDLAQSGFQWLSKDAPLGKVLFYFPLVTAVADYLEDIFEMYYLRVHGRELERQVVIDPADKSEHESVHGVAPAGWATTACFTATCIKFIGVLLLLCLTLAVVAVGAWRLTGLPSDSVQDGWRGALALLASGIAAVVVFVASVILIKDIVTKVRSQGSDGK